MRHHCLSDITDKSLIWCSMCSASLRNSMMTWNKCLTLRIDWGMICWWDTLQNSLGTDDSGITYSQSIRTAVSTGMPIKFRLVGNWLLTVTCKTFVIFNASLTFFSCFKPTSRHQHQHFVTSIRCIPHLDQCWQCFQFTWVLRLKV